MNRDKKIVIMGPIPDELGINLGGVAEFTVSLADSLNKNFDVTIVTNVKSDRVTKMGTKIVSVGINKKYSFLALLKMYFAVKKIQPDTIISSLQYSFSASFIKGAYKVHFIHGFPSPKYYSKVKLLIFKLLDYFVNKKFDLRIANSNYTRVINEVLLNNKVDAVVPLAVNQVFLQQEVKYEKNIDILFVGRIVEAKGIFKIVSAIKILPKKYKIYIVGEGADFESVKKYIDKFDLNIVLTGRQSREKVRDLYLRSKVFISLNDHEPFGITFIEALACGCQVVCPSTGGQVEELIKYPERTYFLKGEGPKEIGKAIEDSLIKESKAQVSIEDSLRDFYSYDRVSRRIIELTGE